MCVCVGVWLGLVVAWSAAWLRVWPPWGACGVVRGWLLRVHVGALLGWVLRCLCCVVYSVLHLRYVVRDALLVLCELCCVRRGLPWCAFGLAEHLADRQPGELLGE